MHTEIGNIEIMIVEDADEIIQKRFDLLLHRYQTGLEQSMKGNNFVFLYVDRLHYNCPKISVMVDHTYIHSLQWIKNKKATINLQNNKYCFQYAVTAALNHETIGKNLQRITIF